MSANTFLPTFLRALQKWGRIDDPGNGGTLAIDKGYGVCSVDSGTRKLPTAAEGAMVIFFASGTVTVTTLAAVTVATMTSGQGAVCISDGNGNWPAKVFHHGALDIEAQLDLVANGPLTEAALTSATATAAAWRTYCAANGPLKLPPLITLTDTLDLPYVAGGTIEGLGYSESVTPTNDLAGPVSNVIWAGARTAGSTMITYRGQQQTIRQCNLHGATRAQIEAVSVAKVPIILQLVNDAAGLGTGKLLLEGVSFEYGEVGVNISDVIGGSNCDRLTFDKCFFDRMAVGVRVNNTQGMGHFYREPHIRNTDIFLDYKGGGALQILGGLIANGSGILLNFDPAVSTGFGANASEYSVTGIKIDTQAANTTLIKMVEHNPYYCTFYMERIHFPSTANAGPAYIISGETVCHVIRNRNLFPGACAWKNAGTEGDPMFIVENCRCIGVTNAVDLFNKTVSSGPCKIRVTGCYDNSVVHTAIADSSTTLTGDL